MKTFVMQTKVTRSILFGAAELCTKW